jgi:hypothetical protein
MAGKRTFEVEAVITVTVDGDETAAREQVDVLLQRAHDTDRGRHHVQGWHFELLDGGLVTEIDADGKEIIPD